MPLKVKFFASLSDHTGLTDITVAADQAATVLEAWNLATGNQPMPANTLCAVNMAYARHHDAIHDGDEIAFFPPVTGGQSNAMLRGEPFDPWQELARVEASLAPGKHGACASFVGTMRDFNVGESVHSMSLEHYPEMTQQFLETICHDAARRWDLVHCLIIHRYGDIKPGEPIVLTAAWSGHRVEAFEACRYLIEELKARAPFWKKETTDTGDRWVHDSVEK